MIALAAESVTQSGAAVLPREGYTGACMNKVNRPLFSMHTYLGIRLMADIMCIQRAIHSIAASVCSSVQVLHHTPRYRLVHDDQLAAVIIIPHHPLSRIRPTKPIMESDLRRSNVRCSSSEPLLCCLRTWFGTELSGTCPEYTLVVGKLEFMDSN